MSDDSIIAGSARQDGVGDADILHAYRNPIRVWDLGEGFTIVVGATASATLLEVGYVEGDTAAVIVPAMVAREQFLR